MQKFILKIKNSDVPIMMISFVFLVCSCAGPQKQYWTKAHYTKRDLAKDERDCMKKSQQERSSITGGICTGYYCQPDDASRSVVTNQELFEACMKARGWKPIVTDSASAKFTGRKTVSLPGGGKYEGEFVDGKRHGKGKYTFAQGGQYEGDFFHGIMHGRGMLKLANGNQYKGEFVNGQKQGRGTYTFIDGDKYEGDWVDNKATGQGIFTYSNGDKYEGEFVDLKLTGKGIFTCANGKTFRGNLKNKSPKDLTERCQ